MELSSVITPVAILLELIIFVAGVYAGYVLKKNWGYLFGFTFLVFAFYDYFGTLGISADILSLLNIIAILAALAGMYQIIKENAPRGKYTSL
jgi:hypothetical protein